LSSENDVAISRYDELLNDFKNLALNRFKWNGLPLGLTSERLEEMLITHGQVFCFKRKEGTLTILPCRNTNKITVYGDYDEYEVFGYNEYIDNFKADEGIRLKNNPTASNNITTLMVYSERIDNTEKTQDVNLFQQNIPKIVLTDDNGKLTAKALLKQLQEFKVFIFGRKSLTGQLKTSDVLDTTSPYLLDKLQEYKTDLINEVLSYLGINNNSNSDKRERLTNKEVDANNELTKVMLDLMYDLRVKFCEDVKAMFNHDITVEKRRVEDGELGNDTGKID
jgi:hypothetical protein